MIDAIEQRRSIRKFKKDGDVSKEQLTSLVRAAMLAPSACNTRPWEFIVITNKETLLEIARIHPNAGMCEAAPAAIIMVAIPQNGIAEGFFPQDCGAATENILLEAAEMGLGTCWCGVYPKQDKIASLTKLLNIGEGKLPFNVIAVGVADETPASRGSYDEKKVTFIE